MGAALCVYLRGVPVIDLWGGLADARRGKAWTEDTVGVIFSCTKGLMSVLAARLVEDGRLDYDAPVTRYWPEFGAAGKGDVRVRHLLNHQAGLSAPRVDLSLDDILDWSRMTALLAEQEPLWPPGTGYAYHAITHGWLVGELVRRVTGKPVAAAFRDMIAGPLDADAWIGLPDSEHARMTHLVVGGTLSTQAASQVPARRTGLARTRAMTLGGALPPTLVEPDGGFNDPRLLVGRNSRRRRHRQCPRPRQDLVGDGVAHRRREAARTRNSRARHQRADVGRPGIRGSAALAALGHGVPARFRGAPLSDAGTDSATMARAGRWRLPNRSWVWASPMSPI